MGNALAFDTYAYVRKLRDAGLTEQQAAVHAESLVNLIEERLTTKTDLAKVEAGLKEDLARVEAGLKADLAKVEARLVKVEAELKTDLAKVEAGLKMDLAKVEAGLKADLAKVEVGLVKVEAKVETVKAELRKDIETAKVDTIKWVVATGIVILGGMAAINRLVPPGHVVPHAEIRMETQEMRPVPPLIQSPVQSAPSPAKPSRE